MALSKAGLLRKLLSRRQALVVPGCHDTFSARIIEATGFQATQISGFGVAGSFWAGPDTCRLDMKDVLDVTERIVRTVNFPVMADIDTGGGNAINAAYVTEKLIAMGVAGVNIEDQVFPKRCGHMAGKQVIPAEEMAGKVRAMADVRKRMNADIIINARTDSFAVNGLSDALQRCARYVQAGADMVFIDGIATADDIWCAAEFVNKDCSSLLSVNLMDGVTGVKTELIPIPELAAMGVSRVSIPVASIMVMHRALKDFFEALHASPTGLLAGQTKWLTTFKEYTEFVGLPEYRELENRYLPKNLVDEKYKK